MAGRGGALVPALCPEGSPAPWGESSREEGKHLGLGCGPWETTASLRFPFLSVREHRTTVWRAAMHRALLGYKAG